MDAVLGARRVRDLDKSITQFSLGRLTTGARLVQLGMSGDVSTGGGRHYGAMQT